MAIIMKGFTRSNLCSRQLIKLFVKDKDLTPFIIRKCLYMPTLVSIQYNQKIKVFYDRLVLKHKPKKVAVIAAMRKLLLIAHAIHKNKTVYVPG